MDKLKYIQDIVNGYIKDLYNQNGKANKRILIIYGLWNEPINWGDLGCVEVLKKGKVVLIEEAAPDCCNFMKYIENRMIEEHGITIKVQTEW